MDERCGNCGSPLAGDYCFECGQPRKSPIMSVGELVSDFLRDVLSLDSRAWHTLRTLMLRPGRMTIEYIAGRRAAYSPPVRLYLLTSLLFLAIVTFPILMDSLRADFSLAETAADSAADAAAPDAGSGTVPADTSADAATNAPGTPMADVDALAPSTTQDNEYYDAQAWRKEGSASAGEADDCDDVDVNITGLDNPAVERFITRRVKVACRRLTSDDGMKLFIGELIDNLPTMMLILLPIMALVLVLLYPFGGRRYVEHLILLTHFHSFVFVLVGATVLLARLPPLLPAWGWMVGLTIAFTSVYTPWYLYRAMRNVYGQGRLLTGIKFSLLGGAYLVGVVTSFTVGVLLTVWSFTQGAAAS
jgi:hypothetical protein